MIHEGTHESLDSLFPNQSVEDKNAQPKQDNNSHRDKTDKCLKTFVGMVAIKLALLNLQVNTAPPFPLKWISRIYPLSVFTSSSRSLNVSVQDTDPV